MESVLFCFFFFFQYTTFVKPYLNDNLLFDLFRHTTDGDTWVSILGYVIDVGKTWFKIHRGRDITSRMLMQFHDIPMDINDDR